MGRMIVRGTQRSSISLRKERGSSLIKALSNKISLKLSINKNNKLSIKISINKNNKLSIKISINKNNKLSIKLSINKRLKDNN
jgi:hypothetical protein